MVFSVRRLSPLRDRHTILERRDELIAAAVAVDERQQRLATQMTALRTELRTLRDRLWPAQPGRAFRNTRRPRIGGPAPIPPPTRNAIPVRGADLRFAALGVLVRSGSPMTLPEIHRALHLTGFRISGAHVVKQLADALGYEHRHGRARRVARGTYAIGELSPARRRRALSPGRPARSG
jgi:hypothetical protein